MSGKWMNSQWISECWITSCLTFYWKAGRNAYHFWLKATQKSFRKPEGSRLWWSKRENKQTGGPAFWKKGCLQEKMASRLSKRVRFRYEVLVYKLTRVHTGICVWENKTGNWRCWADRGAQSPGRINNATPLLRLAQIVCVLVSNNFLLHLGR